MEATRRLEHPGALGAVSAIGDLVATGSWTGELRLWNARKGQLMGTCPSPVGGVRSLALCDEPPRLLVSGADGLGVLMVGDTGLITHIPLGEVPGATEISLSSDGRAVLTANPPIVIELETERTGRVTSRSRLPRETLAYAQRARFSGRSLLVSAPELIMLLDWRPPYEQQASFEWRAGSDSPWLGPLDLHPGGMLLVAVCEYRVLAWTLGPRGGSFELPELAAEEAFQATFSPDGTWLALGYDRHVELRTGPDWKPGLRLSGPDGHITGLVFGRENLLAATSEDGGLYVWELP